MKRLALLACLAAAAPSQAAPADAAPPQAAPSAAPPGPEPLCRAEVLLEPARAYVGQPVLHRVRIEQQRSVLESRWETSLSFPAFRAEPLLGPGVSLPQSATTETSEERRVLFPARAGRLALPAARIECESAGRIESAEVPARELVAEEPPLAGRPGGWAGLIGPVEVTVYATPDRVTLGESVSISVVVRGTTNVWAAPVSFAGAFAPDEAEWFERPPELARDMGRELVLRSYRSFDLVPRRAGVFVIPELRVAYFDPARGAYAETRTPPVEIAVAPRADGEAARPEPGAVSEAEAAEPAPDAWPRAGVAAAALALAAACAGLGAGFWLGRRPATRVHGHDAGDPAAQLARAALAAALAAGDANAAAAAAARVLRLRLEAARPGARALSAEELAGDPAPESALLARLDAARFGAAETPALLALAREAAALDR